MQYVSLRNVLAAYGEDHPPFEGDVTDYRATERRAEVDTAMLGLTMTGALAGGDDDAA